MSDIKQRNLKIFFMITAILNIIYLLWRTFFTLPINGNMLEIIFGILLLNAEITTYFTTFELYYRKISKDKYILTPPDRDFKYYPDVDVFIATHNEPVDILYKTANACTFMEYPDKSKVHVYLCDDTNRQEVLNLANDLGIGYLGLSESKHAKAGNYNNALSKTNSPLIATFDADMIPQSTFLMKTIPYFFLNDVIEQNVESREINEPKNKIGLVQTPQSFYNPDLFQFNLYSEKIIPNEQDFFSKEVNVMRNSSNAVAYTGSNTVLLRKAIEDIGGFPTKTITEDFEVSIRMQKEKYITYATQEVLASGLTTTDFKSMIKQRIRWARGIIQSLHNTNAIFTKKFSIESRLTYLSSYLYWWSFFNRLVFILSPILFGLFDLRIINCEFGHFVLFWLPAFILYNMSFRFLSSNVRTNRWSQIVDIIFAPYLVYSVILESFGIRENKFKVTSKVKNQSSDFVYAMPHIVLIGISIIALIRVIYGKYGLELIYSSIIIFWLGYNLFLLFYAVIFMTGRQAKRKTERFNACENIEIYSCGTKYIAKTVNISDEGLLFCSEQAICMSKSAKVIIITEKYTAILIGEFLYSKTIDGKLHYAMQVKPVDKANKRQYFQIIYDREHSLPKEIDKWYTIFDDLKRNIVQRMAKR